MTTFASPLHAWITDLTDDLREELQAHPHAGPIVVAYNPSHTTTFEISASDLPTLVNEIQARTTYARTEHGAIYCAFVTPAEILTGDDAAAAERVPLDDGHDRNLCLLVCASDGEHDVTVSAPYSVTDGVKGDFVEVSQEVHSAYQNIADTFRRAWSL